MAQDLKTKQSTEPELGEFWRDMVNGDVLRIEEIDETPSDAGHRYARCACYPRGKYFMGIQEMKTAHFGTERFQRAGWFKSLWYKLKFRGSKSKPLA